MPHEAHAYTLRRHLFITHFLAFAAAASAAVLPPRGVCSLL